MDKFDGQVTKDPHNVYGNDAWKINQNKKIFVLIKKGLKFCLKSVQNSTTCQNSYFFQFQCSFFYVNGIKHYIKTIGKVADFCEFYPSLII